MRSISYRYVCEIEMTSLEIQAAEAGESNLQFWREQNGVRWFRAKSRPTTITGVPIELRPAIVQGKPSKDNIVFGGSSPIQFTGLEGEADD